MFCSLALTLHVLLGLEPGSTAEWVTAIATIAALAAAVCAARAAWHQLRMQQRTGQALAAEQEAAQARLIAGWVSTIHVARHADTGGVVAFTGLDVTLRNASELPVYEVNGWVRDRKTQGSLAKAPFSVEVLEPASTPISETLAMPARTALSVEAFGGVEEGRLPSQSEVEFKFRDAVGKWWLRAGSGALSKVNS